MGYNAPMNACVQTYMETYIYIMLLTDGYHCHSSCLSLALAQAQILNCHETTNLVPEHCQSMPKHMVPGSKIERSTLPVGLVGVDIIII